MKSQEYSPCTTRAWQQLRRCANAPRINILDQLKTDSQRVGDFSITCDELFLDFSKNSVDREIWGQLLALAEQSPLLAHRHAMFSGAPINTSENRAVLHTALRDNGSEPAGESALERAAVVQ